MVLKDDCQISAQFEAATDNLLRKSVWVLDGDGWATPIGVIAKFAASGKTKAKKNLGLMQIQDKNVYVAYVSMDTNPACTSESRHERGGFRRGPSAKPNPRGAQAGARR